MTEAVGDTGHTDFMTPEERERARRRAVAARTSASASASTRPTRACRGSSGSSRAARPRPAGLEGRRRDRRRRRQDDRRARPIDEVAGWVRGEAGTTVEVDRQGRRRPAPSARTTSSAPTCRIEPVTGRSSRARRRRSSASSSSPTGPPTTWSRRSRTHRAAGAERIVLDLRGNPGGYVNEAVGVASQFLTERRRLHRAQRRGRRGRARGLAGRRRDGPAAGRARRRLRPRARRRSCRARCRTPGGRRSSARRRSAPGTVLGEFELSDGSALRIGTVEWLTPNGRRIWHEGIAPDVPVALPDGTTPLSPGRRART